MSRYLPRGHRTGLLCMRKTGVPEKAISLKKALDALKHLSATRAKPTAGAVAAVQSQSSKIARRTEAPNLF